MSDDTIDGGEGNDTIFAGIGNDLVFGGSGDDVIFDGSGDDTIYGDADNDTFWLTSGSNDGNDLLNGGTGTDGVVEDLTDETAQSISIFANLTTSLSEMQLFARNAKICSPLGLRRLARSSFPTTWAYCAGCATQAS